MRTIFYAILFASTIAISSCNKKSLDDKFSEQTYKEDLNTFLKRELITSEEKELLTTYITANETDSLALLKPYAEILLTAKKEKETADKLAKELAEHQHDGSYAMRIVAFGASLNSKIDLIVNGNKAKLGGDILECKQFPDRIKLGLEKEFFQSWTGT